MRFSAALAAALVLVTLDSPAQSKSVPASEYKTRRAAVAKTIGADGLFIAFSAAPGGVADIAPTA